MWRPFRRTGTRIVVTDVTRMGQPETCCVAGVDVESGERIRPVVEWGALPFDVLAPDGPFELGALVDLGRVSDRGEAPMVEDRVFDPRAARREEVLAPGDFWGALFEASSVRLRAIFGDDLAVAPNGRASLPEYRGEGSLGCLAAIESPALRIDEYGEQRRLRLSLTDGELDVDAPVTDIRFYDLLNNPRTDVVDAVAARIGRGANCILSVGVGRAFAPRRGDAPRHWLQVNGVHLSDDPLWAVSSR